MVAFSRRTPRSINIWPGFVDALAALLLVIIFMLLVFVVAEFYLRETLSGRDEALNRLSTQVAELAELLALEQQANADLRLSVAQLSSQFQTSLAAQDELTVKLSEVTARADATKGELTQARLELESVLRDIEALRTVRDQLEAEVGRLAVALRETEDKAASLEDKAASLEDKAAGLVEELTAERDRSKELEARLSTEQERTLLAQREIEEKDIRFKATEEALSEEQQLTARQRAQVELLNQQIAALRRQLATIANALEAAETTAKEQKVQIADLGRRLNVALAGKVQELARYRSEFFGRLREILGQRQDIRVVGDRFVFQSEVLFETGSADLGVVGRLQLTRLADTLNEIAPEIPPEIEWVLRIDGHTDSRPISTPEFPSNWELSTARAISVVRFLIDQGIPPGRLAATGFGQFQPLDTGTDEIAFRRNRRIELKLTQR
jgi:chemotaxis protein MotB